MSASVGMDRRTFFKAIGGGIVVFVGFDPAALFSQDRQRIYPEDFNAYLLIGRNGRVTVYTGKIEMGQGVVTSLGQMLADELIPLLVAKNYINKDNFDRNNLLVLVKLFQARLPRLNDFVEWADFFFLDEPVIDPAAKEKYLTDDLSKEFSLFVQRLNNLASFEIVSIEASFRELVAELGTEAKKLIHPIRVALTGKTVGPGLFEVIYHLGKEKSTKRLLKWVS